MRLRSHAWIPALGAAFALACGGPPEPGATSTPPAASVSIPDSAGRERESVGGLQAQDTQVIGVMADLVSADREEGVLKVTIRFRNSARGTLPLPVEPNLRDSALEAGGRPWPILRDPGGVARSSVELPDSLRPSESRIWRGEFAAPPRDVTEFDFTVPGVDPFTAIPIRDG
ncbi:MAG TPA: hypothetical protein VM778_14310 [Gemmatimonadota bacterium]|nr:hypothetical protein [Gemmatimonadota bacterium]